MVGEYFINSFSSNELRAYQNFCRQFGKIFIQAGLLRIDQSSLFSPEGVAKTGCRVERVFRHWGDGVMGYWGE